MCPLGIDVLPRERRFEAQGRGSFSLPQALELRSRILALLDFRDQDAPDLLVTQGEPLHFRCAAPEIFTRRWARGRARRFGIVECRDEISKQCDFRPILLLQGMSQVGPQPGLHRLCGHNVLIAPNVAFNNS
ncbi:hypothetical protein AL346_15925 [Chelatococcus sp. CO-6]|nr:hypothetical protein AL346_15925 [Chelatococcus sp. CO-6]